jgi:hypothetical protein
LVRWCGIEWDYKRWRVGGKAELEDGFLGADVVEGAGEGFSAVGVVGQGLFQEGEQALLEEIEADDGVRGGGGGYWGGRSCSGQRGRGGDWERGSGGRG